MLKTDEKLIVMAQQGHESAVGDLYERYHQDVFQYLYYNVGERHLAEDLTSDVFLKVFKAIQNFETKNSNFKGWLYQIARNTLVDHYRKLLIHPEVELNEQMEEADCEDVVALADKNFSSEILILALKELSEDQRNVLVLRFVAGMSLEESSRVLHKTLDSVKGLQRRALLALRKVLVEWKVDYETE